MKIFNINWELFIERLEVWNQLAPESRMGFMSRKSAERIPQRALGDDLDRMVQHEFVAAPTGKSPVSVPAPARQFAKAVRGMYRHQALAANSYSLAQYLSDNFTADERRHGFGRQFNDYALAEHMQKPQRITEFLEETGTLRGTLNGFSDLTGNRPLLERTQQLVRVLLKQNDWVRIDELPGLLKKTPGDVGDAIDAAVAHALVFPISRDDGIPLIGIHPDILAWLNRQPAEAAEVVTPVETFGGALIIEDMVTILVAASGTGLRLKAEGDLFVKARKEVESRIRVVPGWMSEVSWLQRMLPHRVRAAMGWLRSMDLAIDAGKSGKDRAFRPTNKSADWLGASPKEQTRHVIEFLKLPSSKQGRLPLSLPPQVPYEFHSAVNSMQAAVFAPWQGLADNDFYPIEDFLQWQTENANPLKEPEARKVWQARSWRAITEKSVEHSWKQYLLEFLTNRLVPLGGVQLGYDEKDRICFAMTSIGRFVIGETDDFECGQPASTDGAIVIQPNFDVTFLGSSPAAEAALTPLAERVSHGLGTLFRLTKASIYAAAVSGITADQAMTSLESISTQPLPANVKREIKGWFDQCRRAKVRRAILVECPDAETAARVSSAAASKGSLLTDTVVEIKDQATLTKIEKKLLKQGVFLKR